jgi:hypothetical protein
MPTGLIVPNFRAPWYPDQQYLKVNPENTSELFIDYDAMILRRNARISEFHKLAVDFAHDKKLAVPTKKGEYSEELTRQLGGAPKPIQPVIAARQGNVFILGPDYAEAHGLNYATDARLERYVTRARNEAILEEYDFAPERTFAEAKSHSAQASTPRPRVANEAAPEETDETDTADDDVGAFDELGDGTDANVESMLDELEDEFDAEAMGGKTVAPQTVDRAARQAPRRPGTKTATKGAKRPKTAAEKRRAAQRGNRPTLATGAAPVIGSGEI